MGSTKETERGQVQPGSEWDRPFAFFKPSVVDQENAEQKPTHLFFKEEDTH